MADQATNTSTTGDSPNTEIAKKQEGVQNQTMPALYAGPWVNTTNAKALNGVKVTFTVEGMERLDTDQVKYLAERELCRRVQDLCRRWKDTNSPVGVEAKKNGKITIQVEDLVLRSRIEPTQTPAQVVNKLLLMCGGDLEKAQELLKAMAELGR